MSGKAIDSQIRQRGSAMILSVMMMMGLGLLALNTLNQHLNSALALTGQEHRYLLAWQQAASSLSWGASQRWLLSTTPAWQCQSLTTGPAAGNPLRSCVRPANHPGIFILKGEGQLLKGEVPLVLYQLASHNKPTAGRVVFTPLKGGWVDFCPLPNPRGCDE